MSRKSKQQKPKPYRRSQFESRVAKEAARAGLFLLVANGCWQFHSTTTGKWLLNWWPDGRFSGFKNSEGHARSVFGALYAAIALQNKLIEEAGGPHAYAVQRISR